MATMDVIPKFMDPYDRVARLYPGLLVMAPVAVLLVCLYGTEHIFASSVLSILGFCGVAYAFGRVARDAGKRIQNKLFIKWGGAPTTQLLRHRDTHFDTHTKERFHNILAKGLKKDFPTADEERMDPTAADEFYQAGTLWLIGQTRDTKTFPLVFKENVAFGFHRNSLGLRPYGVAVAMLSLLWNLLHAKILSWGAPHFSGSKLQQLESAWMVSIGISLLILSVWIFMLNEGAMKRTGFSYAERLLQSCDRIKFGATSTKTSTKGKA